MMSFNLQSIPQHVKIRLHKNITSINMNYGIESLITVGGLVLATLIGFFLNWSTKKTDAVNAKLKSHENRLTIVETEQKAIKASLSRLANQMDNMPKKIMDLLSPKRQFISRQSPPQLKSRGLKIAKESGLDDILDGHRDQWLPKLVDLDGYILFIECQALADKVLDDLKFPGTKKVKDYFYNQGLDAEIAKEIFTLRLRDTSQAQQLNN